MVAVAAREIQLQEHTKVVGVGVQGDGYQAKVRQSKDNKL
jgi:hypothetical protein